MLAGWLDWQHRSVELKCAGLSEADAYRAPLPTSPAMSVVTLVSHLTVVEREWLQGSFLGDAGRFDPDQQGGCNVRGDSLADVLARYRDQCTISMRVVAEHPLDELEAYAPPGCELVSLRWIVTHLIEETGRHLGHLDLLRELADGSRGQ